MEKSFFIEKTKNSIKGYIFNDDRSFIKGFLGQWQLFFFKKGGGLLLGTETHMHRFITKCDFYSFMGHFEKGLCGVAYGYYVRTDFFGVGYRVRRRKRFLVIRLGYNHRFGIRIPINVYVLRGKKNKLIFFLLILIVLKILYLNLWE